MIQLAALAPIAAFLLTGPAALAGPCAADADLRDPIAARLPLDLDGRIEAWARDDPTAAAEHAFVAGAAGGPARVLRVTFRLDPSGRGRAGIRVALDQLDASAYDHLELAVRGAPGAEHPRAFEVGFLRQRPDRPDMMASGSHVIEGVGDRWRRLRIPLNRMTGIASWDRLDTLVLTFAAARSAAARSAVAAGAIDLGDLALVRTGDPGPSALDRVPSPKKLAWEAARGGQEAARAEVAARLRGWPATLLASPPTAADDRAFLMAVARDSWRGLAAMVDDQHGLPIDHLTLVDGGTDPDRARTGDYTSPSNVGLWLMAVVAAEALGLIEHGQAIALAGQALATLAALERLEGFHYNFYDTTTLERTSNFVSSVDAAWLTAGLMVLRSTLPELAPQATGLIEATDYGWLYDPVEGQMFHGQHGNLGCPSEYHYGLLYTEARVLSLIAIGKGDVPPAHWYRLQRTIAGDEAWQTQPPKGRTAKRIDGVTFSGGWYELAGERYVPSWGGSMFEALMPMLVVDELVHAPESLGRNAGVHVALQRQHAREVLRYPVWGLSPSATIAGGYGEFGVAELGVLGYPAGVVTPHASALALALAPAAATDNLRKLAEDYPIYGEYGFYDALDPLSGAVGYRYLTLDQAMLFLAIANHLAGGVVQRHFAADPIAARVLPMLAAERFFDPP